jgi:hypothetical protein
MMRAPPCRFGDLDPKGEESIRLNDTADIVCNTGPVP